MKKNISNEKRQIIINSSSQGYSPKAISETTDIPLSTVYRILKEFKDEGKVSNQNKGGARNVKITDDVKTYIKDLVNAECDISLAEISKKIFDKYTIKISKASIFFALKGFNYSLKLIKKIPLRRISDDTETKRKEYARKFFSLLSRVPDEKIFFIDEVGFNVSMRNNYGRSEKGKTPELKVNSIRSRNLSICCAINKNKIAFYKVSNRAYNTESFLGYISEIFRFFEEKGLNNITAICDNVPFHKSSRILEKFSQNGNEIIFLPPYSPNFNPIENMFSKWKRLVRNEKPQDEPHLLQLINEKFLSITENDCNNFYRKMLEELNKYI